MQLIAPVSRNAPCPCGSGRRYKDCHGTLASPQSAELERARQLSAAGDHAAAEPLCRAVLQREPGNAEALGLLGIVTYEQGRPMEALNATLQAVKALSASASRVQQQTFWSQLNYMFTQALSGLDTARAAEFRKRYESAHARAESASPAPAPLVSIAVLVSDFGPLCRSAIDSALRQTHRPIEVVVACLGADNRCMPAIGAELARASVPHRVLHVADASEAGALNAAVRACRGEFVQLLPARHALATARVERMLDALRECETDWGFSAAAFVDAHGHRVDPTRDADAKRLSDAQSAIDEADSVGCALIAQENPALDVGNLFFSRALFDAMGGFRDITGATGWDFALRAVWRAEPAFIHSQEFLFRTLPTTARASEAAREAAQLRIFGDFYATACGDDAPPNRFAPSPHGWGLHFYKRAFQTGHVLMFPFQQLEALTRRIAERRTPEARVALTHGVNLVGFAFGEFGLGENLRAFAKACGQGGIPFAVRDVDMRLRTRQADRQLAAHVVDRLRHRCSLFCLNPDMLKPLRQVLVESSDAGGYNIGYWFWELETIPREWDEAIHLVDEIWVATEFVAAAVRKATTKPVIKIPTPIEVAVPSTYDRRSFDLPEDRFLFLFTFDFNSFSRRKNPEAAVDAFRKAFERSQRDVGFVIKSTNGANQPELLRALTRHIGGDDRILLLDHFMSRDMLTGLQSVTDAFVSLHRAEGLGLGLAECMYLGKPVIGTAYSGNLEFMTPENSCLVGYRLVPVQKGEYLYYDPAFRWAEPDIDEAALHMRRLVDDVAFRTRIASQGQRDIRARFTHLQAANLMRARLTELGMVKDDARRC
jgi:glycosyltransferase involved in cell wall biosynthesis